MSDTRDRLAAIGKRFIADKHLFTSVQDAARKLAGQVPSYSTAQNVGSLFRFAGQDYELSHRFSWTDQGVTSRVCLLAVGGGGVPVAAVEIYPDAGLWRDGIPLGLTLPTQAEEAVLLLLALSGPTRPV